MSAHLTLQSSSEVLAWQQAANFDLLRNSHSLFTNNFYNKFVPQNLLHFLGRTSYRRPFRRRYGAHFLRLFTIHIHTHRLGWAGSAIIPFTVPHYARCNSACGELMLLTSRASVASLRGTCCQASSSLSLFCQFKIILFGSTFGPVPACSSL